MQKKIIILISVVAIVIIAFFYFNFFNRKVVYIASSIPNFSATVTKDQLRGIQIALDDAGYKAGRFDIKWLSMDDGDEKGWNAQMEENNAKVAVNNPDVVAFYGPYNSGAAKISMPILNKAGILQLSVATWPGLTRAGYNIGEPLKFVPTGTRNFFRLISNDSLQGKFAAEYLKSIRINNVAVVHDNGIYGRGISMIFKNSAESIDMTVSSFDAAVDNKSVDLIVKNIVKNNPPAVFIGGDIGPYILKLYTDLRIKKYTGVILGTEFVGSSIKNIVLSDDYKLYTVISGSPVNTIKNSLAIDFYEKYVKKYKDEPTSFALFANQSMRVMLKAIESSDGTRAGVLNAIKTIKGYDTAFGPLRFDINGDTLNNQSSVLHMVRGNWKFE